MSIKTAFTLAAFAAAGLAAPAPVTRATTNLNFNSAITAKGKLWFGSAIDTTGSEVNNAQYMSIWDQSAVFGSTTPGNTMKWEFVEPTQNQFTFTQGEQTITLAKNNGKKVRCHNLVWSSELPSWVTSGTWTNATLTAAMQNHITKTIEGFGESCYSWDVVNEAIADSGSGYQSNPFLTHIGPAYIPLAFRFATEAIKANNYNIKLVYNDYGIEAPGAKNTATVNLVKTIKAYGAQIDAVGFESHFSTSYYPTTAQQMQAMAGITALGVDIFVTELDVSTGTNSPSAALLATQAQAYYDTVSACMQTKLCQGVTVWDFDDAYSWIQPGDADLYYSNLTPHPAATAVMQAIAGSACTVC